MPAKRYFLKGIDYFQLLIDHHNKRHGGPGHEARLAIYLNGKADESSLRNLLQGNEICEQLRFLHISKTAGLGYPSLVFSETGISIPVTFNHIDTNEIPSEFLNKPVDVYNMPPLHVQVLYFANATSCILFTFHHILFDFAGVQSFVASLTGIKNIPLIAKTKTGETFTRRFKRFFDAVFFTFREANNRMSIPERELPAVKPLKIIYKEICFNKNETAAINEKYEKFGLQLNKSIFHVACTSIALHSKIFSLQKNHKFLWIPVPVNFRKKGTPVAVLFNGLSFLFYKLFPEQLNSLEKSIATLILQMKDQMRKDLPKAFVDFADGYWYMPMPFYYPMMNLPSWGKLSSFSFSTLGNTFAGMENFMGLPVTDIKNFPSNSISPGITFLFYEFRGQLRLMTSWVEGQYTTAEHDAVLQEVKMLMTK